MEQNFEGYNWYNTCTKLCVCIWAPGYLVTNKETMNFGGGHAWQLDMGKVINLIGMS